MPSTQNSAIGQKCPIPSAHNARRRLSTCKSQSGFSQKGESNSNRNMARLPSKQAVP
jgi:hypothetical protein